MAELQYLVPGQAPRVFALRGPELTIGSDPASDIVISDPLASPCHAVIRSDGTAFELKTTDRKLELLVNDKQRGRHTLRDGDVFSIGICQFSFRLFEAAPPPLADRGPANASQLEIDAYRKLAAFSAALAGRDDVDALLEELIDALIELSRAHSGFLLTSRDGVLEVAVARNVKRENVAHAVEQMSDSIVARCVETRAPVLVESSLQHELAGAKSIVALGLCSALCVPLLDRTRLLGVIYLGSHSVANFFTTQTQGLVSTFASQAALLIGNAMLVAQLRGETAQLKSRIAEPRFGQLVGTSPAMQAVFARVDKVAATEVSVLITGETGTGKELIAREIHRRSPRRAGPFVAVNCGAIPAELLESELFGHVKGAFTGAVATKLGMFGAAQNGTLFLDEIGELALGLQVKLLRALQERVIMRVGAEKPEAVNIRIVTATHRDLEADVKTGRFREDLFYRLNVVHIDLPPLRDRGDDVVIIARTILGKLAAETGAAAWSLSPSAVAAFRRYGWPGNIRELENRLRRAVVFSSGPIIDLADVGFADAAAAKPMSLADAKEHFARQYVRDVLASNRGNRSQTARDLDVDPRTIYRYIERAEGEDLE
ncbi:MAG: sigma 54-interacting transcriptional regulator [Myxococcales bacterium]|nr:sigma 54-interacting transcriptional regulator [Myxococcales bacterium]